MKNVVALFSEASDADQAIKKLSGAGLDTGKAHVHSRQTIEQSTNVRPMPAANTAISAGENPAGPVPGTAGTGAGAILSDDNVESYLTSIGVDGNELSFYKHGITDGGHIVVIAVTNDEADKAAKVLSEAGGRAPKKA
jgi:hypothetical protein